MMKRVWQILCGLSFVFCALLTAGRVWAWWRMRRFVASLGFSGPNVHIHDSYHRTLIGGVGISTDLLIGITAVAPMIWAGLAVRRWIVARGHREGFCAVCGYDLRASVGRCPECGTEIEAVGTKMRMGQ